MVAASIAGARAAHGIPPACAGSSWLGGSCKWRRGNGGGRRSGRHQGGTQKESQGQGSCGCQKSQNHGSDERSTEDICFRKQLSSCWNGRRQGRSCETREPCCSCCMPWSWSDSQTWTVRIIHLHPLPRGGNCWIWSSTRHGCLRPEDHSLQQGFTSSLAEATSGSPTPPFDCKQELRTPPVNLWPPHARYVLPEVL